MENSILPEKISKFEYYVSKLPLYLQNCDCFKEHFRIWYEILVGDIENKTINNKNIKGSGDTLLKLLDIFNDDYLNFLNLLGNTSSDFLDKLGSIFNVQRKFSAKYFDISTGTEKTQSFNLQNDKDFLTLIKAQIIKNYSDGSYIQMKEFYDKIGLFVNFETKVSSNTSVNLFQISSSSISYSDNIKQMFLCGLLTIESMGINYNYVILDYDNLGIWNVKKWDANNSKWGA